MLSNTGSLWPNQTATATGFVALALPRLPVHQIISHLRKEWRTPFREPLQFIVMSVMGVISLYL
jgi:hypothetical protein